MGEDQDNQAPAAKETRMSFGQHLDELRTRLILGLVGIVLATILCFVWTKDIFGIIIRPSIIVLRKYGQDTTLQSLSPPDTFLIYIKIALLSGLIISFPWVLYQAWKFVATGLYERERRFVRMSIIPSIILFISGVCFMYFIVLPLILNFFASFNQSFPVPELKLSWIEQRLIGSPQVLEELTDVPEVKIPVYNQDPQDPPTGTMWINSDSKQLKVASSDGKILQTQMRLVENTTSVTNQYSIDFYVSFVLRLSLAFGVAFQMPLVVIFLALTGLVSVPAMAKARGYVCLAIVIGAAVLTPPDVVSQIMLAIPMMLLYEGGLLISRVILKRKS